MSSIIPKLMESNINKLNSYFPKEFHDPSFPFYKKLANFYKAVKLYNEAFPEPKKKQEQIQGLNITQLFKEAPQLNIGKFIRELEKINKKSDAEINANIEKWKLQYNSYFILIKAIKYFNEYYNKGELICKNSGIFDYFLILKTLVYVFIFLKNKFNIDFNFYTNGKILSFIYAKFLEDKDKFYDDNFYYGAYKEVLFKIIPNFKETCPNFDKEIYETYAKELDSICDYFKGLLAKNMKAKEMIEEYENTVKEQIPKEENDINELFIFKSILSEELEDISFKTQDINTNIDSLMAELNYYKHFDIEIVLVKNFESTKLAFLKENEEKSITDFSNIYYINIHEKFINDFKNYLEKNKKVNLFFEDENKELYIHQKNFFLKFLDQYLVQRKKSTTSKKQFIREDFLLNLDLFTYYTILILHYIDNKQKLAQLTYEYLLYLSTCPFFNTSIAYHISSILLKQQKQSNYIIINIIKQFANDIFSFILWQPTSEIFSKKDKIFEPFSKGFYTYVYELIDRLSTNPKECEKIFNSFKLIINYGNGTIVKGQFIDLLLIYVYAMEDYLITEENDFLDRVNYSHSFDKIKEKYLEKMKISFFPGIYENLILDKSENDELDYELANQIFNILKEKEIEFQRMNQEIFPSIFTFNTIKFASRAEGSSIYSSEIQNNENFGNNLLSKKRIRPLTPTVTQKSLTASPLIAKSQNAEGYKVPSIFKNLAFK